MNSLYIGVGVAIILALVTALVGPLFVDWGTHRALFEAEASRIVGLPVRVLGDVDARLLPSPRVRFGDVVIGDLAEPVARVGRFELDLDVAGLIRGETRVSELALDRPAVDLVIDEAGRLAGLPDRAADLSGVQIETVRLVDGRLRLVDRRSGGQASATRIEGRGAVESLAGTWRLEVTGLAEGRPTSLRLAARRTGEGPRLRFQADVGGGAATASGDVLVGGGAGRPGLGGSVTVETRANDGLPAAAVSGALRLDLDGAELGDLAVRIGAEETGARLGGGARAIFGAKPSLSLDLTAKRLDLDAGGATGGAAARLSAMVEAADRLAATGVVPRDTHATLDVDTLELAGGLVSELTASLSARAGGWAVEQFGARLPGDGRLSLGGRFDLADRRFDGIGTISVTTPEDLAAWWSGGAAADAGIGEITASGPFTASRDGMSGSDLTLSLGGERAQGRVEARAGGLLRFGLSAKRLDGRRLAALLGRLRAGGALGRTAGLDLDLDVGEIGLEGVAARGAQVALHVGGDAVTIDRLTLAELAGARISASGRIDDASGAPKGRIEARFAAEKPGAAARALIGLVAPRAAGLAEAVATAAGPVDLTLSLDGRPAASGGAGSVVLGVTGRAAGGDLRLDAHWEGRFDDVAHGRVEGSLASSGARLSEGAARLLDARPNDRVILSGSLHGRAADGLAFAFDAGLGDRRLTTEGEIRVPDGGAPTARLEGRLIAPDVGLLAGLVGRPVLALERRLPVDLTAKAEGWGGVWTIASLDGTVADARVEASGRLDLGGRRAKVDGRLGLDRADLETLVGAAFGAPADFELATTVGTLDLDGDRAVTVAAATLTGEEGAVRARDLSARYGATTIGGDLRARPAGAATTVSGRLSAETGEIALGAADAGPRLTGRLSGDLAFEATGRDRASLLAALSGSGRLTWSGGRLIGASPTGLKAPREGEASAETIVRAMAGREIALPPIDLPVLVEGGRAQTPRIAVDVADGRVSGRVTVDLGKDRLDGSLTVEPTGEAASALASAVSHAVPTLDLALGGTLAAPRLDWNTTGLAAFLTLHRLEREIEAAEVQRQDRIERLRFSTILKRIEERRRARETPPPAPSAPIPANGPGAGGQGPSGRETNGPSTGAPATPRAGAPGTGSMPGLGGSLAPEPNRPGP